MLQCQEGKKCFDYYDFYDGPDSLGSAGLNLYVSEQKVRKEELVNATTNDDPDYVFSRSNPTKDVRLEASVGSIGVCSF